MSSEKLGAMVGWGGLGGGSPAVTAPWTKAYSICSARTNPPNLLRALHSVRAVVGR